MPNEETSTPLDNAGLRLGAFRQAKWAQACRGNRVDQLVGRTLDRQAAGRSGGVRLGDQIMRLCVREHEHAHVRPAFVQEPGEREAVEAVQVRPDHDHIGSNIELSRLEALRDRLESGLREQEGVVVFASEVQRLPNTTLFTAPGVKAETAVIGFDLEGVAVSSGSACSSGKVQPSHVLQAMGVGPEAAQGAVRLSLGWSTCDADINRCLPLAREQIGLDRITE